MKKHINALQNMETKYKVIVTLSIIFFWLPLTIGIFSDTPVEPETNKNKPQTSEKTTVQEAEISSPIQTPDNSLQTQSKPAPRPQSNIEPELEQESEPEPKRKVKSSPEAEIDFAPEQQIETELAPTSSQEPQEPLQPASAESQIIGTNGLIIALESQAAYDRSHYGEHKSNICSTSRIGAFTALPLESCHVDHVVALKEAHQSGGHAWSIEKKKQFSQDPINHLATRACVNSSKGARDAAEWTLTWIAKSKACGGGYKVVNYCTFIDTTITVKLKWGLTVDSAENKALKNCTEYLPESEPELESELEPEIQPEPEPAPEPKPVPQPEPEPPANSRTCIHWHAGHKKHTHPGRPHDGTHISGKCEGF